MKKTTFTITLLILIKFVNAQENKLFAKLNNIENIKNQASYVMKLQVANLKDNRFIISLKNKLNSKLNTINSCMNSFVNSKELKLSENEITELKKRIEKIAAEFYKSDNYALLKTSDGTTSIYGTGIETIANKKVIIVHLGGDCNVDKIDLKRKKVTNIFNSKMELLLKN
ncbi:hypothetical protein PG911_14085 [Tenacibaculum ovolyticum]|uniref:hypothetical protein n=1 Tax=Tenacibaculum ovolyticum TaxID=104270 RepID=UPI0007EC9F78|nr:hypothetical protein [Tenacibaculum ovolyticum]WBX75775.1 hypothetical protein PG911_14085 [Tenacibaculum ovolyticum]